MDIDDGLSIDAAVNRLQQLKLNHIIITSKSHQKAKNDKPAVDRFHIIIPFNKSTNSIGKYRGALAYLQQIFPEIDNSTRDLARFFFYSPLDAEYHANLDHDFLDIDDIQGSWNLKETAEKTHKIYWEFNDDQEIRLADGSMVKVRDITTKQPCHCPRPEHVDNNPSAFVDYVLEQDRYMIYCSACDALGWSAMTRFEMQLDGRIDNFYFCGKDIIELGIAESQFYATKTARDAYYILLDANSEKQQDAAFRYLIEHKRLSTISRVDYVGDVKIDKDQYSVDINTGVIEVKISAIPEDIKDNAFIENYLIQTFGKHHDFIKQYLAMYVYTNYVQLPTLILYGPRGSSKTTFAEMVGAIYPNLHIDWKGDVSHFTPEAEKKLAVIEENELNAMSQYKILKKYSGQKMLLVNKKYQPEYMVRNNLNVMLLSNEAIPIYVEKMELPTDENNNQFFVWKFPDISGKRDGDFLNKLKKRLGHYIRTELAAVFNNIDKNYSRYGISVPITEYEKELFNLNVTNVETSANLTLESIINYYESNVRMLGYIAVISDEGRADHRKPTSEEMELLKDGFLTFSLIQKFANNGIYPNTMIKNLKKRNIIIDAGRKIQNKQKFSCYQIIDSNYKA